MAWARAIGAIAAGDFSTNEAMWNGGNVGSHANIPGWSFTRASTRYVPNASGVLLPLASGAFYTPGQKGLYVEGARTNLLLRSQELDNASWSKSNCTVTADQAVAPDGTTTADKVESAAGAAGGCQIYQSWTSTATTFVYSIYVKQGSGASDANIFGVRNQTAATNLIVGTLDFSAGIFTHSVGSGTVVTTLANGWYRLAFPIASGVTVTDVMRCYGGFSGAAETPGEFNYAWGAQIEAGVTFPSSYIPTTTASATRAADVALIGSITGINYPLTLFAEFERVVDTGGNEFLLHVDSASERAALRVNSSDQLSSITVAGGVQQSGEAVTGALALATTYRGALRVSTNDIKSARGGTLSSGDAAATNPSAPSTLRFGTDNGSVNAPFGLLKRWALIPSAASDAALQAMTT